MSVSAMSNISLAYISPLQVFMYGAGVTKTGCWSFIIDFVFNSFMTYSLSFASIRILPFLQYFTDLIFPQIFSIDFYKAKGFKAVIFALLSGLCMNTCKV